jgi:membrane protein DedA with SNARE-associated domain
LDKQTSFLPVSITLSGFAYPKLRFIGCRTVKQVFFKKIYGYLSKRMKLQKALLAITRKGKYFIFLARPAIFSIEIVACAAMCFFVCPLF